jgi:5-hydroxyisourate hydrolase
MEPGALASWGRLTTHVLDMATGKPAAGVEIELFRLEGQRDRLLSARTNADGRCDSPLLCGAAMTRGVCELVFHVGSYFKQNGVPLPEPPFFDLVPIRFGIAELQRHYHVPLLISPYGYSTYRGS